MKKSPVIQIKRVYEAASKDDGIRFLVDRLWPRGIRKETLAGVKWLRDVAPSDALRKWFGHEPAKWKEFQKRYRAELENNPASWGLLLEAIKEDKVTLLYSAKDIERNQATVLKEFLEERQ
jgi:uncharacterized protein YeaO (DUF488 family)